jgi:hypothetical protein
MDFLLLELSEQGIGVGAVSVGRGHGLAVSACV